MDRERARIADVGDVKEHLQAMDELPPAVASGLKFESDHAAIAAGEIAIGAAPGFAAHQAGKIT
jgi:hypothetical protein